MKDVLESAQDHVDELDELDAPRAVKPVTKEESDARFLEAFASENPKLAASEGARLSAQRVEEATVLPGEELETYDEAFARLKIADPPTVQNVIKHGVVRRRRKG